MSAEFEKGQIVKIVDGSEYPYVDLDGKIGEVIGTIPSNPKSPDRVMVQFGEDGLLNIRPEDLEKVDPK